LLAPPQLHSSTLKVATMVAVISANEIMDVTTFPENALRLSDTNVSKLNSERAELMAWNSVGRRIAAVFVEAADEVKAEELKVDATKAPYGGEIMSSDCAKAMCSPAPSSVYPTDVSTAAGTNGALS